MRAWFGVGAAGCLAIAIAATETAGFSHTFTMMAGFWALVGMGYCIAKAIA